jgi:lipopolysaccharide transport system ATP-binding protein
VTLVALAVRAEGLSKRYRLGGHRPARLLYEEIAARLRGRRSSPGDRADGWIWALSDVSFEVEVGDVVGVVGRNGAGKSTLLRVLSRITDPTSGRAEVRGRLASLLEVGTGFHPELTGRENVFLNGAILGLGRREIAARFDEIVAFAEVERFLDTPVKHYSSGMFMRLAFAVAAHLEPDVLVVDEVLAVGDAAFQRKCLGRMESIAESGRTVLFVSHNLAAVRTLCASVLLLENGRAVFRGPVEEGLARYERALGGAGGDLEQAAFAGPLASELVFVRLGLRQNGHEVARVDPGLPLEIVLEGRAERDFRSLDLAVALFRDGCRLFTCHDGPTGRPLASGPFESRFELPASLLRPGVYTVGAGAQQAGLGGWTWADDIVRIEVSDRYAEGSDARDIGALSVSYRGSRRS